MERTRWRFYVVTWLTEVGGMLLVFAVSRSLAEQGVSLLLMGGLGGVLGLALSVSTALGGWLSGRAGRRPLMIAGLLLILVAMALCLYRFGDLWAYWVGYLLLGVGLGVYYPALMAQLVQGSGTAAGFTSATTRTLVAFSLAWNLGLVSGQFLGGGLFDWLSPRGLLPVAMIFVGLGLVWVLAPSRTSPQDHANGPGGSVADHVADRLARSAEFARLSWIANVGSAFSISLVIHLLPKLTVDIELPADQHGVVLAVNRVLVIFTYLLMHWTRFWHYRLSTSLAAQAIGVSGLVTIALADHVGTLMVGIAALGVLSGHNYFASLYYSSTGSVDQSRDAAFGLHEATLALGSAAGPICGGVLASFAGERSPYLLGAALVTVLAIAQVTVHSRRAQRLKAKAPPLPARVSLNAED